MKRTITALLLAAGVFGVSVAPGPAQARDGGEKGRSERSGLTLEFWGGLTRLSPRDLNRQADYDLAYVGYFFRRKFDFLRTWRGGSYSYVQTAASLINFPPISGAAPVGFRVRLNLDRVWSLSLGLDFLSRTATTYYSAAYAITDLDPDNVEFNGSYRQLIDFPQWRLAVRGWTPTAAVHARTRLSRRIYLEGHAGAGILFARCAATREYVLKTTEPDGFWEINGYLLEMKGDGIGVSLEAGARAGLPLSARIDAFVEGGYAYRIVPKVAGSYAYRRRHEDANSAPYETRSALEDGVWRVESGSYDNYWGRWNASWPAVRDPAQLADSVPFRLNLSGFQLKVGLAWNL